jgi:hypothetical protein
MLMLKNVKYEQRSSALKMSGIIKEAFKNDIIF